MEGHDDKLIRCCAMCGGCTTAMFVLSSVWEGEALEAGGKFLQAGKSVKIVWWTDLGVARTFEFVLGYMLRGATWWQCH